MHGEGLPGGGAHQQAGGVVDLDQPQPLGLQVEVQPGASLRETQNHALISIARHLNTPVVSPLRPESAQHVRQGLAKNPRPQPALPVVQAKQWQPQRVLFSKGWVWRPRVCTFKGSF